MSSITFVCQRNLYIASEVLNFCNGNNCFSCYLLQLEMKSRRRQWTVGKRCLLLLIVPFLCCQVSALECPADDFNSVPTSNEYDTSSYSKGALGR